MKIVEIINNLTSRHGAEIFLINLCKEMKNHQDIKLYLISLYNDVHHDFVNEIKENGIEFFTLGKNKKIDLKASKRLKRIIKDIKPDVVHMHLSCMPTYFFAFGLKPQAHQLVQTFHNVPSHETNIVTKLFVKKHLITYVGIADEITSLAKESNKDIVCYTIYNGIPLIKSNKKMDFDSYMKRTYDFVIVASMIPAKNHQLLFDAFAEILKNKPAKLLCVGDGPLINQYKEYCKQLGIENNVTFTGGVSNVRDYLDDSRCITLVSIKEGNPISILEAMNAGLPAIASDVGGVRDIIKAESGLLFPSNNKEELINSLLKPLQDWKRFYQYGQNNIELVKKYSIDNTCNEYINLFKQLIEKRSI